MQGRGWVGEAISIQEAAGGSFSENLNIHHRRKLERKPEQGETLGCCRAGPSLTLPGRVGIVYRPHFRVGRGSAHDSPCPTYQFHAWLHLEVCRAVFSGCASKLPEVFGELVVVQKHNSAYLRLAFLLRAPGRAHGPPASLLEPQNDNPMEDVEQVAPVPRGH